MENRVGNPVMRNNGHRGRRHLGGASGNLKRPCDMGDFRWSMRGAQEAKMGSNLNALAVRQCLVNVSSLTVTCRIPELASVGLVSVGISAALE